SVLMNPKPLSVLSVRIVPVKFVCLPYHCPRGRAQDPAAFRPDIRFVAGADWRSRCAYFNGSNECPTQPTPSLPRNEGVWALVGLLSSEIHVLPRGRFHTTR